MRALVCSEITDDLTGVEVSEVATPDPGPGEVRIRVKATSVNYPDLLLCQGNYQLKLEPPFTPGMDISGEIDALGEGVVGFERGDSVVGGMRYGGFAEFAVVSVQGLQRNPSTA